MPNKPLSNPQFDSTDATFSWIATKIGMAGGTLASVFGWFTSNGAAVFVGILITILGFVMNAWFQRRRDARELLYHQRKDAREEAETALHREHEIKREQRLEEMHQAQLEALRNNCAISTDTTI